MIPIQCCATSDYNNRIIVMAGMSKGGKHCSPGSMPCLYQVALYDNDVRLFKIALDPSFQPHIVCYASVA